MASREEIGNLVVSATLDAQGFQNGVSNLKRDLAVAKSEFTAASASLGSFGSEIDKLQLRSDSLTEQMSIQQKIVDTLNAAYTESAATKGEDAKQTEQLAIKLNNAKAALATMADQLKVTNIDLKKLQEGSAEAELELKSLSEAVEGTKAGIESTHAAMVGMLGIMAGGMLAEWTDGAEHMAVSLQKLQAETGETSPELERLAVVASGAGVSTDQLSAMVGRLDMRVGNATVGTKSFVDSLDKLGINAKEFAESNLSEQSQLIAEGMEKSNLPAKELSATLKGLGIDSKELGSNMQENLKVISGSLAETSQNGSTLGRALKEAGINMNEFAGADTETKLQMLGKYFEETQDKTKATALVMQVFGKSGQDMLPLIQNFAELDDYAKTLKMPVMDTQEIQLAAEKTKMLQTAMQMMMDSVLVKVLPIVDNLGKAFYNLVANINHPIEAIKEFEESLGPVAATITGVVTAFTAMKVVTSIVSAITEFKNAITATATALRILTVVEDEETGAKGLQLAGWISNTAATIANTTAKVASTVATGAMAAATKAAAIAQAAFNAVMDVNPIALVVLAIAGLVAGIVALVTHWQTVVHWLQEAWQWFTHLGTGAQLAIAGIMPIIGIPVMIIAHWSQIKTFFVELVNSITHTWNSFVNWISGAAQAVANFVVNAFNWMYNHNYIFQALVDQITGAWHLIQTVSTAVWNAIVSAVTAVWNALVAAGRAIFNGLVAFFTFLWNSQVVLWNAVWNGIRAAVTAIWNGIVAVARTVFQPIANFFSGLWSGISGGTSSSWNGIGGTLRGLWNGIVNDAENIFNGLGSFFTGLWNQAEQWGANLVHMIAQGIKNAAHEVADAAKNVADSIAGFLGFHSPAKMGPGADADSWMPNLMGMLVDGIQHGVPKVQAALNQVFAPPMIAGGVSTLGIGSAGIGPGGHSVTGTLPSSVANVGGAVSPIQININAPVYGVDDLNKAIKEGVEQHVIPVLTNQVRPIARAMGLST